MHLLTLRDEGPKDLAFCRQMPSPAEPKSSATTPFSSPQYWVCRRENPDVLRPDLLGHAIERMSEVNHRDRFMLVQLLL